MKNKNLVLIIASMLIILTGCNLGGKRGSGIIEEERRDVEEFSEIEISGAYEVDIIVGESREIIVKGDDNLLKYISTEVRGNKLIIENTRNINPKRSIFIRVSTQYLESLEASGASDIYIDDIDTEEFYLNMSGACSIEAEGRTERLKIHLSGAGDVDAKNLRANEVKVNLSGASSATVYADTYLVLRSSTTTTLCQHSQDLLIVC